MQVAATRWEKLKLLFDAALHVRPEQRQHFLLEHCSDPDLVREADSLLRNYQAAGSAFSRPVAVSTSILQRSQQDSYFLQLASSFSPNDLVAERFRIVKLIGVGGMGEVYEAQDLQSESRVAIKTIRAEWLRSHIATRRFKREVYLAKKVSHPNISRIFDLFEHRPADASRASLLISMELLAGETLSERIRRTPLSCGDALALARQMASGLDAAHQAGIVHRDFKPANVMLVPRGGELRAVITDFGIAHSTIAEQHTEWVTTDTLMVGTPPYMSPEQILGGSIDQRTDVFSFGVTLYLMVTGSLPFAGQTAAAVLDAILHTEPIDASQLNTSIPSKLLQVIHKCLEKDRGARFENMKVVVECLADAGSAPISTEVRSTLKSPKPLRQSLRKNMLYATAAVVVAACVAVTFTEPRVHPPALSGSDRVIVSEFMNSTGDSVFDGSLKAALEASLSDSRSLQLFSKDQISATLRLMGHKEGDALAPELARQVCVRGSGTALVSGEIATSATGFDVGVKVLNCNSGDVIAEAQKNAPTHAAILPTLAGIANELRAKMGESLNGSFRSGSLPAVTTTSLEALRAYTLGRKIRAEQGDLIAIPLFKHAIELDPEFASAYDSLGSVYDDLQESVLSAQAFRKAFELRDRVSEKERYHIDWEYYSLVTGEMDKGISALQQWMRQYPADASPYISLSAAYMYIGRWEEALAPALRGLELDPDSNAAYENVAFANLALNRLAEAKSALTRSRQRGFDSEYQHGILYQIAFLNGERGEMQSQVAWAENSPESALVFAIASDTESYFGKTGSARDLLNKAIAKDESGGLHGSAALWHAYSALRDAEFGDHNEAIASAEAALRESSAPGIRLLSAVALARAGQVELPLHLLDELRPATAPRSLFEHLGFVIRAAVELNRHNPAAAIRFLEGTRSSELGFTWLLPISTMYPVYLRGEAYLAAKQGAAAKVEFERILNRPGLMTNSPFLALAQLGLARSYASLGERVQAKVAYQRIGQLWNRLDAGSPIQAQAKEEAGALK